MNIGFVELGLVLFIGSIFAIRELMVKYKTLLYIFTE